MREKFLYVLCFVDGIICLISLVSVIKESFVHTKGLAALSSVGRWVISIFSFGGTAIILIVIIALIIVGRRKRK